MTVQELQAFANQDPTIQQWLRTPDRYTEARILAYINKSRPDIYQAMKANDLWVSNRGRVEEHKNFNGKGAAIVAAIAGAMLGGTAALGGFSAGAGGAAPAAGASGAGTYIPGGEFALPPSLAAENAALFNPAIGGAYVPGGEAALPPSLAAENRGTFQLPGRQVPAGGSSVTDLAKRLVSPRGLAGAASLLPLLTQLASRGGNNSNGSTATPTGNPFADLQTSPAYDNAYATQQRRLAQGQPAFDAIVAQAYGMTPTRYRGAAPEGVIETTKDPVSGAYVYAGPQFGREQ